MEEPRGQRTRLESGRERAGRAGHLRQRERNRRAMGQDDRGRVAACNLDIKNPHSGEVADPRSPTEILDSIIEKERRILAIMDEMRAVLEEGG